MTAAKHVDRPRVLLDAERFAELSADVGNAVYDAEVDQHCGVHHAVHRDRFSSAVLPGQLSQRLGAAEHPAYASTADSRTPLSQPTHPNRLHAPDGHNPLV